jgi:cell wall-associated NlpC family hydrolase
MYYVLTQCGLNPPRTAARQYLWLREHQQLRRVAADARATDDPSLSDLRPGDLLFWATGDPADDAASAKITHVAMYLGRETMDGLQIMINATDGRSYRGTKANGYGVYDFKMPTKDATAKLVGYGTPPGLVDVIEDRKMVPPASEPKH